MISRIKRLSLITPTCWLWLGCLDHRGYGRVGVGRRSARVHIVAYEELVGPVPDGHVLDHECRVRHCFNPAHLTPRTGRENTLRGESFAAQKARQTHCVRGHELAGENLLERTDRPGRRECRTCKRTRRKSHRLEEL